MAEKPTSNQLDSTNNDHLPSVSRKLSIKEDPLGVLSKVPDPDEGLSDEERHKLVSR